jgi:N utilization substance protein B
LHFRRFIFGNHHLRIKNNRVSVEELITFAWIEKEKLKNESMKVFSAALVAGTIENINDVDSMIQKHLINWDITRLNRVDLAVLRISVYSMMYQYFAPSIVIDEAIGICREFGTDDSFKFVNGVLDGIRKTLQKKQETLKPEKGNYD